MPKLSNPVPPLSEVEKLYSYDPSTGDFFWKINRTRGIKAGDLAGSIHGVTGYRTLRIGSKNYAAHRIAWPLETGETIDPVTHIDHIDGNPLNNAISNLRKCNPSENIHNSRKRVDNKSGTKGVHWVSRDRRWRAQIGINGKIIHVGQHKTVEEAAVAIKTKRDELHGEFTRHD